MQIHAADLHEGIRSLVKSRLGFALSLDRLESVIAPYITLSARQRDFDPLYLLSWLDELPVGSPEFQDFVDAVVVSESSFLRHREQLEALVDEAQRLFLSRGRPLRIWSAGCARGEEAYSIAMLLDLRGIPARILGTDIHRGVIRRALAGGPYSAHSLRALAPDHRDRYFHSEGEQFRLAEPLRKQALFQLGNLLMPPPLPPDAGTWDLIVCRNVFIYFGGEALHSVLNSLVKVLSPQGSLWLGAADTLVGQNFPMLPAPDLGPGAFRGREGCHTRPQAPASPIFAPRDFPAFAPSRSRDRALQLMREGLTSLAERYIDEYLAEEPENGLALIAKGNLRLAQHDFDAAKLFYECATVHAPELAESHYYLAVIAAKLADFEGMHRAAALALSKEPRFWPARYLLARSYAHSEHYEDEFAELARTSADIDLCPTLFSVPEHGVNSVHLSQASIQSHIRRRLAEESRL